MSDRPRIKSGAGSAGDFRASAVRHASMGSYSGFVERLEWRGLGPRGLAGEVEEDAGGDGGADDVDDRLISSTGPGRAAASPRCK